MRAITVMVWTLAAGSGLYWGVRFSSGHGSTTSAPQDAAPTVIDPRALARILGATEPNAEPQATLSSRFVLQGVIAGAPGGGAALIAIDGNPPKPFRVGSVVEEGLVLKSATARQVMLSATRDGPALVILDMPLLD
ncbi:MULTISPECIES: general secretion pathway protein C [unclassified Polaromonas]|uniref:general secretion pathway protein C n=1 Tax=unclassified Polaromonas TaxID=2638319 RepID=UPI001E60C1FC|nr:MULTISPECIES: general secretion pathway protein C [unclassified Polaromonas]